MEKTCRLVHITYRENNRGPGREEYNGCKTLKLRMETDSNNRDTFWCLYEKFTLGQKKPGNHCLFMFIYAKVIYYKVIFYSYAGF